ncbi:hypothetical protein DXG01_007750 [Tephrocybe rancida]|nr:hypothetical protein DXG01_007750 [Tephrocybe rancida]
MSPTAALNQIRRVPDLDKLKASGATTSNVISLSDEDTQTARRLLTEIPLDLLRVESQLSRLPHLQAEQVEYMDRIQGLKVALAPHKRLYSDILTKIFLFAAEDKDLVLPPYRGTVPWVLRRVCSEWRRVSLNCSGLWNNMVLIVKPHPESVMKLKLSASIIARYGPLTLTVKVDNACGKALCLDTVLNILAPHLPRTRMLTFSGPQNAVDALFRMPSNCFLQTAGITLELQEAPEPTLLLSTNIFEGPELRSMKISVPHDFRIAPDPLPRVGLLPKVDWANIVFIDIVETIELSLARGLRILQDCPKLHTCALRMTVDSSDRFPSEGSITLPHLERLELVINDNRILDSLTLPSLTEFNHASTNFPVLQTTELIKRSGCTIQQMKQTKHTPTSVPDHMLIEMLTQLASVVILQLIGVYFSIPVLQTLAKGRLLPHATVFGCCAPSWESVDAFADLMEARFEGRVEGVAVLEDARLFVNVALHPRGFYRNRHYDMEHMEGWNVGIIRWL